MEETNEKFCILPRRQREKTIWYYYIYDEDGKRIYRSTGQTNKAKAKAIVMKKYKDGDSLIFSLNGTKPVDFQFVSLRLHRILEANGIDWRAEGLSFHSFRHFFNTRLVADGVNGELVRA